MTSDERFEAATAALAGLRDDDTALIESILEVIPVTGAAVSTVGDALGSQTIAASDDIVARLDELQFDLGEGPCWDALATASPVQAPSLTEALSRWPTFGSAIDRSSISAIFAFPLTVGPLRLGAIDMYNAEPGYLDSQSAARSEALSPIIARYVMRRVLEQTDDSGGDLDRFSRRAVHQATGFVIAQLGVSADDALLVLRGRAFSDGRSVREVADDVIARRLIFTGEQGAIEDLT